MAFTRPKASQINFDTTNISDPLIRLNSGQTGSADKDVGIVIERGNDTNVAVIYDESADSFALINTTETGTTAGNVTIASYANLRAGEISTTALTVDSIIVDGTNIGHTSDTDAIAIASNGVVTFSQIPVLPANSIDSDYYVDGSIDTAHIADNQITLAKMAGIARGKIIYGDASGNPAVLTAGSNTQVLTSDGTDISWADAAAGGATDIDGLSDALTNSSGATIGLGTGALANDDGSTNNNTALGYNALNAATTGAKNVAVGYGAGSSLTGAEGTTFIGYHAGLNATGDENTAVGTQAMQNVISGPGTGKGNIAIGYQTMYSTTGQTPTHNIAIGNGAGKALATGGNYNNLVGTNAGLALTTGGSNIAMGYASLAAGTSTSGNVALGHAALNAITTSGDNTAIGRNAGTVATGSNNTFAGSGAGDAQTSGNNNIILGYNADGSSTTVSNEITLGNASVTKFRIPGINFVNDAGNVGIGTSSPSVKLELNNGGAGSLVTFTDGVSTNFNFSTSGTVGTFGTDAGSTSLALKTTGTERMRIDSSGNVGIGTTAPTEKLDVVGNVTINGNLDVSGSYTEGVYTISDGASIELDPANGTIQLLTLGDNRSPAATNFAAGQSMTLMIDDGSDYSITWPSVTWKTDSAAAPTLNTSGYTVVVLWKVSSTLYGARVGDA